MARARSEAEREALTAKNAALTRELEAAITGEKK